MNFAQRNYVSSSFRSLTSITENQHQLKTVEKHNQKNKNDTTKILTFYHVTKHN